MSRKSDPIQPWFHALEELGDYIGIRFGHIAPGSDEVEWHFLPHTEVDGIGGFARLLRSRGADLPELPRITHPAPLSWGAFLRSLPQLASPRHRLPFKPQPRGEPCDTRTPTPAFAWHVFSEKDTARIRRSARTLQASVNSLLLKYLDRTVRNEMEDPSAAVPWMVPVNLRGKVIQPTDTENHSSYVAIRIYASDGAREVHQKIYDCLRRGQHAATWKSFAATRHLSTTARKKIILADRATLQWNVGSFSNLGEWDPDRLIDRPGCKGIWLFAPPVLASQVIGAGCVTFQGRLALTLQLHTSLTSDPDVPREWLKSWVREIELGLED